MLRWHLRHSYHSGEIKLSTHIPRTCGRREKWPSIYGFIRLGIIYHSTHHHTMIHCTSAVDDGGVVARVMKPLLQSFCTFSIHATKI